MNGLVFKIKFNHFASRKDTALANLLNSYLYFEKERIKKLAFFWIFFLKCNGLVGEKNGYPSSVAYLIILINYLQ